MIKLRHLFNRRRFADCENPRQSIGDFAVSCRLSLSLFCEETEDGGVQLLIGERGKVIPAHEYPLPEYIHERIECWNAWASHALETEWEKPMSPYGPEAYGAAIAINIASELPGYCVDWCGLPVHDDYALLQYAWKLWKQEKASTLPESPMGIGYNRYIRNLHRVAINEFCEVPTTSLHYLLYNSYDYGRVFFYETAKAPKGMGDWNELWEHMFLISPIEGFPEWLQKESNYCGEIYGCDTSAETLNWRYCRLLFNFRLTALGIDVMRYLRTSMPVVASHLYIAYPEDFPSVIMRPSVVL